MRSTGNKRSLPRDQRDPVARAPPLILVNTLGPEEAPSQLVLFSCQTSSPASLLSPSSY